MLGAMPKSAPVTISSTVKSPAHADCLIVGMGYLGQALAEMLSARGTSTAGWVRTPETAARIEAAGGRAFAGDAADAEAWRNAIDAGQIPEAPAWVVHCAAARGWEPAEYRRAYVETLGQTLAHVRPTRGLFFVSATSVYGQETGEWIDENAPTEPPGETGRILLEAEQLALDAGGTVLRAVGIYGPTRGMLWQKLLAGEAKIEGDGSRWLNYIHRDDLAGAILHLMEQPETVRAGKIFHVCDDLPVTMLEYYEGCAAIAGQPVPPFAEPPENRKPGPINKRVSNAALRATGWQLRYPTFREGFGALWEAAQKAK